MWHWNLTIRLPAGYSWGKSSHLQNQHWGVDIGAEEVACRLANTFSSPVLIANVSRLLIDYNRPLSSDTLIRTHCDSLPVDFNQGLTEGSPHLLCSLTEFKEKLIREFRSITSPTALALQNSLPLRKLPTWCLFTRSLIATKEIREK